MEIIWRPREDALIAQLKRAEWKSSGDPGWSPWGLAGVGAVGDFLHGRLVMEDRRARSGARTIVRSSEALKLN